MGNEVILQFSDDRTVATIALGNPDERAITLTHERLSSFEQKLAEVRSAGVRGLVIRGPSLDMFSVGADVGVIQKVDNPATGAALAAEGQRIYAVLESLPCLTVAAISGPCVGGGCELVLACKVRVISDQQSSLIGLPETKLGILPGFGGTQRLPRVVGLPKALDVILGGKTLRAAQAKKIGLVDEVVAAKDLWSRAEAIARGTQPPPARKLSKLDYVTTFTALGRKYVASKALQGIQKETKGRYPAPERALHCCLRGFELPRDAGYALEAEELGKLIVTPQCKSLVRIFFLTEHAKSLGKGKRDAVKGIPGLVVGAGTMGAGLASLLAKNGHPVVLRDASEGALVRGKKHIWDELKKLRYLSSRERNIVHNRIEYTSSNSHSDPRTKIVIEAVFENLELKRKILSELAGSVGADCILATNTSSLPITQIAQGIRGADRVIGMHFFNPVEKMPLVEIIRGEKTSEETIQLTAALAVALGKFPIVVGDVPGFLVNRILVPYLNEAGYLLDEGFGPEEIDRAATDFGMPMGPLRLLDEVGLDVAEHVGKVMQAAYGERMASPHYVSKLVAAGRKGRKSGGGFYSYEGNEAKPYPELWSVLGLKEKIPSTSPSMLTDRLILQLVNEAWKCLSAGVAGERGKGAEETIDLGTVMGMGFPPFHGGVLHYAERRGVEEIRGVLEKFSRELGSRYAA